MLNRVEHEKRFITSKPNLLLIMSKWASIGYFSIFHIFLNSLSKHMCAATQRDYKIEPRHEMSNNVVFATSKGSD